MQETFPPPGRSRRVRRMKRYNTVMLIFSVLILTALSGCLLARIYRQDETIGRLSAQVGQLSRAVDERQELLELMEEELQRLREEISAGAGQQAGTDPGQEMQLPEGEEGPEEGGEVEAAHKVYLTFDDGPSVYTDDILDILEEYGVKATFFVVGKDTEEARESMKDIVEAGHTLGMHSYSHKYSEIYASVEAFAEDFAKAQEYIYDVTGVKSSVYRFPGGSSNSVSKQDMEIFGEYLHSQGVTFFDWNISSGDGGSAVLPVETLLKNCTGTVEKYSTSVILMHDSAGKKTTVEALPEIIETILEMDDTVILPITEYTEPVQHRHWDFEE